MYFKISDTNRGKNSFTFDGYLYRGVAQTRSANVGKTTITSTSEKEGNGRYHLPTVINH